MAIETYFKNIADAIRERAGSSGLITPAQMPQAIRDIPGGGGSSFVTPGYADKSYGYINFYFHTWNSSRSKSFNISQFEAEAGNKYALFRENYSLGSRDVYVAYFNNKYLADFLPTMTEPMAEESIYTPNAFAELTANTVYYYTPDQPGSFIFMTGSSSSYPFIPSYCVKMEVS